MPTNVKVTIRGHAICYQKEPQPGAQKVWHIVFLCDDEHHLKITGVSGPGNPPAPPPNLHEKHRDNRFDFLIDPEGVVASGASGSLRDLINLSDTYAHGANGTNSRLKHDRRKNKTDLVTMTLPFDSNVEVSDCVGQAHKSYIMQISPEPMLPHELARRGIEITARFTITKDMAIRVGTGRPPYGYTCAFVLSDPPIPIEISVENDCQDRCSHNDSIDVYEALSDKIAGNQEIKFVSWTWPPLKKNIVIGDKSKTGKAGNCDPILIDPPPID